jgi:transposase
VATTLKITLPTVGKWRQRFVDNRLDGLVDEPRPGTPRTISDAQVEEVIARTLESKPKNATHWSTRSMAKALGLSQTAVVRIWSRIKNSRGRRPSASTCDEQLGSDIRHPHRC